MCHLMKPAYDAWKASVHRDVNCHDCHRAGIAEQNRLLISAIFKRPEDVPPRHGKVIVPWKICGECHLGKDATSVQINRSRFHAKHFFIEQIECSGCHGVPGPTKAGLHDFLPDGRFCLNCHEGKKVHGIGMEGLACLNCHTEKSPTLRPTRAKCLYCHGELGSK